MAAPIRQRDPITLTVEAVRQLLAPYFPPRAWGGEPPKVIGLPFTSTMFERIADTTPRIYIGWGGLKPAAAAARGFAGELSFSVLIVLKSNNDVRVGDRLGMALYPCVIAGVAALHGRTITDVGSIEVTEAGEQAAERWSNFGAAAGYVTFKVDTALGDLLGESAAAEDFRKLVSSFEVNPEPDPEPEPDAPSLATDETILLPGASAP